MTVTHLDQFLLTQGEVTKSLLKLWRYGDHAGVTFGWRSLKSISNPPTFECFAIRKENRLPKNSFYNSSILPWMPTHGGKAYWVAPWSSYWRHSVFENKSFVWCMQLPNLGRSMGNTKSAIPAQEWATDLQLHRVQHWRIRGHNRRQQIHGGKMSGFWLWIFWSEG